MRRLNLGPFSKSAGMSIEEYVLNGFNRLEKWSHDTLTRHDFSFVRVATPPGPLTIASGVITVTRSYHTVATQSGDATDDLDTINGGQDGMRLVLRAVDDADTVVVKDATGNIALAGDCSLTHTQDTIELIYDATLAKWLELGRSDNTA